MLESSGDTRRREPPDPEDLRPDPPWPDIVLVLGITAASLWLAARLQLTESLFGLTRHWEHFQVDELPIGMLVLSICLIWMAWKRYRHARRELRARRAAEARLAGVLADNRRLARENLRIQEIERKHLARELHDEFGQYLNAIKLDAVSIRETGGADAAPSTEAALAIIRSVDHVHEAVSGMIARLRPVGLDELGLVAAIEHCIDQWRPRLPETEFSLMVRGEFADVDEPTSLTVYRVIQEGLTNVHKHARARHARIALERSGPTRGGELQLTVADDGCGMEQPPRGTRFGLSGMRERVEAAGGTFRLDSAPGQGLRITAHIPLGGAR